jgi:hypothetical protein
MSLNDYVVHLDVNLHDCEPRSDGGLLIYLDGDCAVVIPAGQWTKNSQEYTYYSVSICALHDALHASHEPRA